MNVAKAAGMRPVPGLDGMTMEDKKQCACQNNEQKEPRTASAEQKASELTHWDGSGANFYID